MLGDDCLEALDAHLLVVKIWKSWKHRQMYHSLDTIRRLEVLEGLTEKFKLG